MFVFVWSIELEPVRRELGGLYPLVRYLIPFVLVVVTAARAIGGARPAWRLVVDHARDGALGLLVTVLVLFAVGAAGWLLRDRRPAPTRIRRPKR